MLLAGHYEAATGVRIDADFAPTVGLLPRLRGGERADIAILTREGSMSLPAKALSSRPAWSISHGRMSASP